MKIVRFLRSAAIAALVLSGMTVSPARASTAIFAFNSPANLNSTTQTYSVSGLSIVATGYDCVGALQNLCANSPNTLFFQVNNLYANSDGLGFADANARVGTKHEIPNYEFIQLNFSTIAAGNTISSIEFQFVDFTSWSLYASGMAGELQGSGGQALMTNEKTKTSFTVSNPTISLYSVIAGTDCHVVLNEVIVTYSAKTIQPAPEPATFLLTGLTLLGLVGIVKKARKQA